MYVVKKENGLGANVVVENTITKATVNLGRLNSKITDILAKDGLVDVPLATAWCFNISKETATELTHIALNITKPIRDQRKKPEEKKDNSEIDAMDVLLGLAHYN